MRQLTNAGIKCVLNWGPLNWQVLEVDIDKSCNPPAGALLVQKITEIGVLPVRSSNGAAGYDLASPRNEVVTAGDRTVVKLDIAIRVPPGTYGRIAPRSGLAVKHGIDVGAGVIDADYNGNVGVLLFNHSDTDFNIAAGDRIAQLLLERIVTPDVTMVDFLPATKRGEGGFGSTGTGTSSAASSS